ncbi:dispanin subfamily A member 2b-like [Lissotriton helveticus]
MSAPYTVNAPPAVVYVPPSSHQMQGSSAYLVPSQRDYVLWSFFNAMFCNVCCLGFVALVYSIKARDRKVLNDVGGASAYGRTAKQYNIAVSILIGICLAITLISVIVTSVSAR